MARPRDLRRLAFQLLFQLDARPDLTEHDLDASARESAQETGIDATEDELRRAVELARGAWQHRRSADDDALKLAPGWPAHRQPATDRAIIRLAHHEMTRTDINPKIVVNEAVELAKQYSTDKSPGFVNAVLDKVLKRELERRTASETAN